MIGLACSMTANSVVIRSRVEEADVPFLNSTEMLLVNCLLVFPFAARGLCWVEGLEGVVHWKDRGVSGCGKRRGERHGG